MVVSLLSLALVSPPAASGSPIVDWEAPEVCPSAPRVQQRLDELLGESTPSTLHAVARVESREGLFFVELALTSATGDETRTLSSERCDLLAEAVVFVVAVAIDPVALAEEVSSEDGEGSLLVSESDEESEPLASELRPPLEEPPLEEPPLEVLRTPAGPAPSRPPPVSAASPLGGGLRVGTSVGVGILPGLDVLLGAAGVLRGSSFRAEFGLQYGFARPARLLSVSTAGADLDQWTAQGRGCWARPWPRLSLAVCGQIEGGAVRARGVGLQDIRTRWSGVLGIGAAVGVALHLAERLSLWVDGQGFGLPRRPAFGVSGSDERLHDSLAGGARASVGLELRLGRLRDLR